MRKLLSAILVLISCFTYGQYEKPDIFFSQREMTASGGIRYDEFYSLESNLASLSKSVTFATTGNYRFDVSAYKVKSGNATLTLSINNVVQGSVSVSDTMTAIYSIYVTNIIAGTYPVKVQITNFSVTNYCRVGLFYFTKSSLTTPYVYPNLGARDLPAFGSSYLVKEDFGGGHLRGFSLGGNGTNQSNANGGNKQHMIDMAATGANIARCFVGVTRTLGTNTYTLKTGELEKLDSTVARGARYGFYVVPALELAPSFNGNKGNIDLWGADDGVVPSAQGTADSFILRRQSVIALWQTLATRYATNKTVAAYDIWNEPRSNFNYAQYLKWQDSTVMAIRAIDANHVIMIECIDNDMFAMMLPFPYDNIVYSPHGYSPTDITHQGVSTSNPFRNTYPTTDMLSNTSSKNHTAFNKTTLSKQHDDVRTMSRRFKAPVFIGEFSCVNWAPASPTAGKWSSTEWSNDNISLIETEGWSWVYHNWNRGGEAIEWDPEIPSSFYSSSTFVNAAPTVKATSSANKSATAPTIVMLKGWFALNAPATPVTLHTWYISSVSGNDNYTSAQAKDINTPWKTLGKMNNFMSSVQPGDTIALKAGETFYGSLIVTKSGTSALPIVISRYGTGSDPIITGMSSISSWASAGTNKYTATITNGLSYVDVVTKNGTPQAMGRWPNSDASNGGWLRFDSYNTAGTTITDDSLSGAINYVNSEIVFSPERFFIIRGAVTAQSGTAPTKTLTFVNTTGYDPRTRFAYFIQGALFTLNKNNEWFYDFRASPKTLTYYSTTGTPTGVEIATVADGITATNFSDIIVTGVHISGFQGSGVSMLGGARNKVINCTIDNCGYYGVYLTGTSGYIYNNNILDCLNTAVQCGTTGTSSTNTIVRKNYIDSTSMFSGHCQTPTSFSNGYGVNASGTGMIVDSNEISHQGFIPIHFYKWNDIKILKNYIHHYNYWKDDGGAIYTLNNSTTIVNTGRKIQGNLITDGVGSPYFGSNTLPRFEGIYLDLGADGTEISGNFSMDCSLGIYFNHGDRNNSVHDNLIYMGANAREGFQATYRSSDPTITNTFRNNVIWASKNTQSLIYALSDVSTLPEIGSDSNKVMNLSMYATPFQIENPSSSNVSFSTWKSNTGFDAHTTQTTFTSTDSIRVYINPSFTPLVLDLTSGGVPYNWITPTGIVSSYTLAGRSAIILKRGTTGTAVAPNATATFSAIACFGETSTITTTVTSGGTAPFTYSINNGGSYQSSNLFTGQTAGTKSIIVKDANNLKDTVSVVVTQPSLLQAAAASTTSILCFGGSANVSVTATGGTTPYSGTGTFTKIAGTYSFTVTDANGCQATTGSLVISQPTVLGLSESYPAIAVNGGTTTITLTATGGTGSKTYKLNSGAYQSSNVFAGQVAGNYTAYVQDANGCIMTKTFTVTEPSVALTAIAANTVAVTCNGTSTATVVVTGAGGTAPYTYSKDGASYQGSATFTSLAAGTYTFYVKDAITTVASYPLTITQPNPLVASATFTQILCYGESSTLTLSASGGTPPYMGVDTTTVLAGAYSKTVTDANGCTYNVTGTVPQPLAALTLDANNYGLILTTGGTTSDTIVASGGTGAKTYSMDGSSYQSSPIFTGLTTGSHTASVKDANNCLTSANFSIPLSIVTATISVGTIACNGGTTTIVVDAFGGLPPYSGTGTFTVGPGSYTYVVTDANGATSSVGATVADPPILNISVAVTNITTVGGTGKAIITASGGTPSYTYSLNGAAYVSNSTFLNLAEGNYSVTVKDSKGCTQTTTFTIISDIPESTTIITRRSGLNVFADFNTTVAGVANMRITDAANQLIKNQNVNVPVGTSTFSISIKSLIKNQYYTFTVTIGVKTSILSFKR